MATPAESQSSRRWEARLQRAWRTRGLLACALLPLSLAFGAVAAIRRWFYRLGWLKQERLPVPVVVVGNIIVGGAGKTPTVIAVVTLLRKQGFHPGVISRGHGRSTDLVTEVIRDMAVVTAGDEPLLLRQRLGVPVFVGRDRVAAARELLQQYPQTDVIVSDDGLQHLRLARDVQIVVFDARGVGNGWLLPAGPLRERLGPAPAPRTLVLYNAPVPSTPWPGKCASAKLAGLVPLADWWSGGPADFSHVAKLARQRVIAAAGTAQPDRFFDMLEAAGLQIDRMPLGDHYAYATLPWPDDAVDVVVTEKDAVKLDPLRVGTARVWVAPLDFRTGAVFDAALLKLLPRPARP